MPGAVRFALGGGAISAALVGLIGLAHLPIAAPLLGLWTGGGCPVGLDHPLTPAARDAARSTAMDAVRGQGAAGERPALGFALDVTSRVEATAWAAAHGVACTDARELKQCGPVPANAIPDGPRDTLVFEFDAADALVSVTAGRRVPAAEAVDLFVALQAGVAERAGPATLQRGEPTAEWLDRGPLTQLSSEFRFADYRAQLTATNLGPGRIAVREVYQALGPASGG